MWFARKAYAQVAKSTSTNPKSIPQIKEEQHRIRGKEREKRKRAETPVIQSNR